MPLEVGHIDALILAGGLGTRLRPVVADRPKPLAEVDGKPFISNLIEILCLNGFRSATLCTGHLAERIDLGALGTGIPLYESRESDPLGTAGALALAAHSRAEAGHVLSDPILVLNGDSLAEADLSAFTAWFGERTEDAALVATQVTDAGRYGQLVLAGDGRVSRFEEKRPGAGPGAVNAGVYLFRTSVLAALQPNTPAALEKDVLPQLAAEGRLAAWEGCRSMIDIGTPEDYHRAQTIVAEMRARMS